jgi:hypothetical protein
MVFFKSPSRTKGLRLLSCQMCVMAKKKSSRGKKTKDLGVQYIWKIYRLAYGFCLFVTSTSETIRG